MPYSEMAAVGCSSRPLNLGGDRNSLLFDLAALEVLSIITIFYACITEIRKMNNEDINHCSEYIMRHILT